MLIRYTLALILFTLLLPNVYAMRCGEKLVYEGDSAYTVLSKCGEPLDKQIFEQAVPVFNEFGYQIGVSTTYIETWIYQKSPAEFQYQLMFDGGILKQINANRNPY
ncbi:DUF2845 domain-containing protein [Legionella shakespearei]|uniref:DUF2845 domain-containing protein n=1 Tax=Legionella shakespearei DSM 23087 TaxID=1122169 RepID=A0A0W0YQX8_9GAMM|nr:DUF2845 domain-containing protein [Legionella shakespearei]KTD59264.1 hypothetical protein Lsha_1960 [Legionella shakespearei DSM 23087]